MIPGTTGDLPTAERMITMKYYIRMTKNDHNHCTSETLYKRYKRIDGWDHYKSKCWKFSKQGARGIIKQFEKIYARSIDWGLLSFDMIPAEEE